MHTLICAPVHALTARAAVYRSIPSTGSEPADSSSSFRVKKAYERMLLEYERRIDAGWNADAPAPAEMLTASEVLMPAGWGVAQAVADARRDGLAALARVIARGDTATVLSDADAAKRIERERQAVAARPAAASGPRAGDKRPASGALLDGGAAAGEAASAGAPAGLLPATALAPGIAAGTSAAAIAAPPAPPPPPELPRLSSEELFRSRVLVPATAAGFQFGASASRIREPSALPLDVATGLAGEAWYPSGVRYTTLPVLDAASLWSTSGALANAPPRLAADVAARGAPSHAQWFLERSARALASLQYGADDAAPLASARPRLLHSHSCLCCRATMRVLKNAALASTAPPRMKDDDDATVDEELEQPAAAATGDDGAGAAAGAAAAREGTSDADATTPGQEGPPTAVTTAATPEHENEPLASPAAAALRRAAASSCAWATCAGCPNVACFPCLFPTPAAAGFGDGPGASAQLDAFLAAAAAASTSDGASSDAGSRRGLSDAGLWFCPSCTVVRGAAGVPLPWCGVCQASIAAPPGPGAPYFGCLASPVDFAAWPAAVRCELCSSKMHAQCAARAGVVVAELPGSSRLVGRTQSESSALILLRRSAEDAAGRGGAGDPASVSKFAFFCRPCAGKTGGTGGNLCVPSARPGQVFAASCTTRETAVLGKLM